MMTGVTRANLEVLQALAQEGIQLSEEELLLTVQSQPDGLGSADGAVASLPRVSWYVLEALEAVLCRVGIHEGPWEYLAEGHCDQMRQCRRCRTTKVRTKHQREWMYVRDDGCEQVCTCTRCNAVSGPGTRHEAWSDSWSIEPAGWFRSETRAHQCERCRVVETWTVDND